MRVDRLKLANADTVFKEVYQKFNGDRRKIISEMNHRFPNFLTFEQYLERNPGVEFTVFTKEEKKLAVSLGIDHLEIAKIEDTKERVKAFWNAVMLNPDAKPSDSLRASENIAKVEGMFVERVEIDMSMGAWFKPSDKVIDVDVAEVDGDGFE